jgi:uncharacterized membrane protein
MRSGIRLLGIINRICAILPVILSLLAFALVLVAVATGWGTASNDEGTAAHLFQILIAAQLPIVVAYVVTAEWTWWQKALKPVAMQAAAIALAFAPVGYFHL